MGSFEDLQLRVDALENRTINVDDIPHVPLIRKLEHVWQPSATEFLRPGTVLADSIAVDGGYFKLAAGNSSGYFNASAVSDVTTVTHNRNAAISIVVLTAERSVDANHITAWSYLTAGANSFTVQGRTVNGTLIGPGIIPFSWLLLYRDR